MPWILLLLLGAGGYALYRRSQQQQPPMLYQGTANFGNAGPIQGGGSISVQQVPPIAQMMYVQLTSDVEAALAVDADGHALSPAQVGLTLLAPGGGSTKLFKAGQKVSLIPDPNYVGSQFVVFADNQSGGHWAAVASEFHWVPAIG